MNFLVFFPGKHNWLWLVPLSFVIFSVFSPNNFYPLGALISAALALFVSWKRVVPIELEERGALKRAAKAGTDGVDREKFSEMIREGLEGQGGNSRLIAMEEKLARAQKAEKKAKSELASFDRDLSSMNFRISELENNRKVQEMKITGLKGENELLHKMVRELREEKNALQEQSS